MPITHCFPWHPLKGEVLGVFNFFAFYLMSRNHTGPGGQMEIPIASHCCFSWTPSFTGNQWAPSTLSFSVTSRSPFHFTLFKLHLSRAIYTPSHNPQLTGSSLLLSLCLCETLTWLNPTKFCKGTEKPNTDPRWLMPLYTYGHKKQGCPWLYLVMLPSYIAIRHLLSEKAVSSDRLSSVFANIILFYFLILSWACSFIFHGGNSVWSKDNLPISSPSSVLIYLQLFP